MDNTRRSFITGLSGLGLAALAPTKLMAGRSETGNPRLQQGPMVGAVAADEIRIWSRASGPYAVSVEYATHASMADAQVSATEMASPDNDFTTVCRLQGLRPNTRYYYRMRVSDARPKYTRKLAPFRTHTAPAGKADFRVCFGSCARVHEDKLQPIWRAVEHARPDLFFWLGDNIYADSRRPEVLAEEYRRQFSVASLAPVFSSVPQSAIWDDHDYGLNDHDASSPSKASSLKVFQNYWANPGYGLPDTPGVFYKYRYGGVDFFFLDVRYHRDPNAEPDHPGKTMLGKAQLAWLKQGLKESDAAFRVLVSGSGWTKAKGQGGDSWASFIHERNHLFNYIRDQQIGGVVLLSGDTHSAELNAVPWSEHGGYDFYDLVSSPLAQDASSTWFYRRPERRVREAYSGGANVGLLDFAMAGGRPKLTFRILDIYGQSVWPDFIVYADELENGVRSYPAKMDGDARTWHDYVGDDIPPA